MTDADPELVVRAVAGESAARAELWRRFRSAVAAVALTYRTRSELEDIVQETALAWMKALPTLRDPNRFEPWLMQIARNVARARARRERAAIPISTPDPDSLPAAAERERDDTLARALATLPEEVRELLLWKSVRGYSQRRIAEILGLPETTVETRLVRARKLLRERLEANDRVATVRDRVAVHPPRIPR